MNRCEVTIEGAAYPCRQTMGAMLYFKRETGYEFSEAQRDIAAGNDRTTDCCVWLWCCVRSACAADGIELPWDMMGFFNRLEPEEVVRAMEQMSGDGPATGGDGQKKAGSRPAAKG